MGKRGEPRQPMEVPVRIFGTDRGGRIFSENVTTVDVSHKGAKVRGVKTQLKLDEIIGLTYGKNKVHFRVIWAGEPGTTSEGQIGLLNLTPEKPLWDFTLPSGGSDTFNFATKNRRRYTRVKCSISVEIHPADGPVIWGKASDLSEGGCFVEMPIPLKVDAGFEIALWLGETKLRLQGEVVSSAPGFGIGVRFVNTSPQDRDILQQHIVSITQAREISLAVEPQASMKTHEINRNAATQEWFCVRCLRASDHVTQQDAERELSQFDCVTRNGPEPNSPN
jgi:PilZ domain